MTKELLQQVLDALDKSIIFANSQGIGGWQPTVMACHEAKDAIKQALAQQEPPNPWHEAVIDQLVIHHIYSKKHDTDPRKAINDLLCISNAMVLNPLMSKPAQDLVDRGRNEAQQEQYPLPDSLYPGSKDWMAGSYKERVEWLHLMYESTRQEVERLEAQQEPVSWEGADGWEPLAWHLCAEENGEESCAELIWEGGSVPEPWGDRWLKYEDAAKQMIATVQKYAAPPTQPALSDEQIAEIAKPFISAMGDHWCHEDGIRDNGAIEEFARAVIEAHCRGGANHG